ncbi:MAG: hypothetical protein ACAH11_14210 [Sphingomonas sp.]
MVHGITTLVRDNITLARLDDGSNVPPETPEERGRPIIPRSLEIQSIMRGELSGQMEICGLDWLTLSFRPYMRAIRASGLYSSKQIAYISMLHGAAQGLTVKDAREKGIGCSADMPARLKREAAETAIETP